MRRIGLLLIAALSVIACDKMATPGNIEGTWSEQYDPNVFAMDGFVEYTFIPNNQYQLHVYDVLSDESTTTTGTYFLSTAKKTITIDPHKSDFSGGTYKIVKLTSTEMAWQKEGTTYSLGTWGSDYRHFIRVND